VRACEQHSDTVGDGSGRTLLSSSFSRRAAMLGVLIFFSFSCPLSLYLSLFSVLHAHIHIQLVVDNRHQNDEDREEEEHEEA
jgi:hypothetical protein